MHRYRFVQLVAIASAGWLLACGDDDPVSVPTERFTASMNGANEKPTARTTPATGTAEFTLRRDTLYWNITLTNITNVSASHIHAGASDVAGGIILPLTPPISNTSITGFITRGTFQTPAAPNNTLTFDGLLDLLRSGGAYVNVHTSDPSKTPDNSGPGDFPGGEIRGQISKVT
jgi:hypothetical protein